MNIIRSVIIDDEQKARMLLTAIVAQYCPQVTIEGYGEDLPSGIKAIKKVKPDLVFLDIEMPGHSGLELLDFFHDDEIDFGIIFTTAYNEYALQAFRFSAIDYLLKPIQHEGLLEAVQRFARQRQQREHLRILQQNLSTPAWEEKRIVVPSGQSYKLLAPADILMIKGDGAYSEIHLLDGAKLVASKNLKHFEDALEHIPVFMRTHKSYLVNLTHVQEYVKSDGGYLILKGNLMAGISPERVEDFWKRFG